MWKGEELEYDYLHEIWIKVQGAPPKWYTGKVMALITFMLGMIVSVDWKRVFRIFYENLRVQDAVRDHTKIPQRQYDGN